LAIKSHNHSYCYTTQVCKYRITKLRRLHARHNVIHTFFFLQAHNLRFTGNCQLLHWRAIRALLVRLCTTT